MLEDTGDEVAAGDDVADAVVVAVEGLAETSGKSVGTSEVPEGQLPQQYCLPLARPTV